MTSQPIFSTFVQGRATRKTSNALKIEFTDGPGDPFAVAVQGGADGRGAKTAVLFGFKNGGTGRHAVTYADGRVIVVHSRDGQPTLLSDGDGTEFAAVERGDASIIKAVDGRTIATISEDPGQTARDELYSMQLSAADGTPLGTMNVIRKVGGWTVLSALDAVDSTLYWMGHAGEPLKIPLLGIRLSLTRPPTALERDVLLGAGVDIVIGLRPYIAAMK